MKPLLPFSNHLFSSVLQVKKNSQTKKYLTIIFLALSCGLGVNNSYAQPCFSAASGSPRTTGTNPQYGIVADFNKDGNMDYAVANSNSSNVTLFYGNGDGTFATPATTIPVGSGPVTVISADFNKDGIMDMATNNSGNNTVTVLMGNSTGGFNTFTLGPAQVTGSQQTLIAGDFNGDGFPDILVPQNNLTSGLRLWVNTGAGAAPSVNPFTTLPTNGAGTTTAGTFPVMVSSSPRSIVTGDFNGDGKLDFAIGYQANSGVQNCQVFLNTSTSYPSAAGVSTNVAFANPAAQTSFTDGSGQPLGAAVGDLNGDGILDLAFANDQSVANVSIYLGNGDGTFTAANPQLVAGLGGFPTGVAIFDYNGDGIPDIVTANSGTTGGAVNNTDISVLRGNGDGTFQAAVNFTVGTGPYSVSTGDFNNDGKPDIITGNYSSSNITILLNNTTRTTQTISGNCLGTVVSNKRHNGNGTFYDVTSVSGCDQTEKTTQTVNTVTTTQSVNLCAPASITVGSTTHNTTGTYTDIAGVNGNGCNNVTVTKLKVFFGNGATSFASAANLTTGTNPQFGTVADFNKDGNLDYAVANSNSASVSLFLGNGSGGFTAAAGSPFSIGASGASPVTVVSADFNNDGIMDLATNNAGLNTVTVLMGNGTSGVWNGTFTSYSLALTGSEQTLAVGDFNGDGFPDLIVPQNNAVSGLRIFLNTGAGAGPATNPFTTAGTLPNMAQATPRGVAVGDFNNDGNLDIALCFQSASSNVQIFLGNGNGTFVADNTYSVGNAPITIITMDLNGDGNLDLATATSGVGDVNLFMGYGNGTFKPTTTIGAGSTGTSGIAFGDFNGDGNLDLVTANSGSSLTGTTISVFRGNGDGTFQTASNSTTGSGPYSVTVGDFNNDGKPDIIAANYTASTASVLLNTQPALTPTATAVRTICASPTVTLSGGPTGMATYSWAGPNSYTSTLQNPAAIALNGSTTGTYTLTIAEAVGGCSATATVAVALPTISASSNSPVCNNKTLFLTGNPSGMSIYSWTGPNGFTSSLQNPGVGAPGTAAAGTYTLKVTDASACTGTASTTVTINTTTVTAQNVAVCAGNSITVGSATHNLFGSYSDVTGTNGGGCNDITNTNLSVLFGNGITSYSSSAVLTTGTGPQYGVTGDFNGDGNMDYAVANSITNTISIFLGNGAGAFPSTFTQAVGAGPVALVSGDFNHDGITDFATNNSSGSSITILMGNGTSSVWNTTFTTFTLTLPGGSQGIVTADFNNDGYLDIAVPQNGGSNLSVFLNTAAGVVPTINPFPTTAAANAILTTTTARGIQAADFNNDGNIDLVVGYQTSGNNMQVFLGNGLGTFVSKSVFSTGNTAVIGDAVGDFNGDGIPDLAAANANSSNVTVFKGVGDGTFTSATTYTVGASPTGVSYTDVNGDGIGDLVIANSGVAGAGSISILTGNGSGGFTSTAAFNGGNQPYVATIGDFNNDGKPDFACADFGTGSGNGTTATVLLNTATSGFSATATATAPTCLNSTLTLTAKPAGAANYSWTGPNSFTSTSQIATIPNVTGAGAGTYTVTVGASSGCSATATVTVVLSSPASATASANTPVCTFSPLNLTGGPAAQTSYLWKGPNSFSSTLQSPEIGVTSASGGIYTITVTASNGCTSTATASVAVNVPASTTQSLNKCAGQSVTVNGHTHTATGTYTDITGTDGNGCSTTETTKLKVFYGSGGNASFSTATPLTTGGGPQYGATADFNKDNNLDYAIANSTTNSVSLFLGNGNGTFNAATGSPFVITSGSNATPVTVITADFNGDGIMDMATDNSNTLALGGQSATVFMGNGSGGVWNGTFTQFVISLPAVGNQTIISGDFNNDGFPDLAIPQDNGSGTALYICMNTAAAAAPTVSPFVTTGPTSTVNMSLASVRGITAGDFNNDGNLDLAVSNQSAGNNMQVFLGNGFGGFTAQATFANGGNGTLSLVNYDFNGDGNLDLASASYNSSNVDVQFGNGSGGFGAATSITVGNGTAATGPNGIAIGDFNGDEIPDLTTANGGSSVTGTNISVLLGNSTGGFGTTTNYNAGTGPYSVTVGDFNNDGKLDIIAANYSSGNATVFLNSAGSLSATATATTPICPNATLPLTGGPSGLTYSWSGPNSFTSTLQSPGIPSVTTAASGIYTLTAVVGSGCSATATTASVVVNPVVATATANTPVCTNSALTLTGGPVAMTSYSWTGPAGFTSSLQNPTLPNPTTANNGAYTLVVTATGGCTSTATASGISVLTAPATTSQTVTLCAPNSLTVGSVVHNATGNYTDRLSGKAHNGCDSIVTTRLAVIFGGSGAAAFTAEPNLTGLSGPQYGTAADFNKDGNMDYAVANSTGNSVSLFLGNGSGGFTAAVNSPFSSGASTTPVTVISADFNKDGIMDLATDNSGNNTVTVMMGNGSGGVWNGSFTNYTLSLTASQQTLTSGDFNGDGYPDLAIPYNINSPTSLIIYMNTGAGAPPTTNPFTTANAPIAMTLGSTRGIVSGDFNGDGLLDLALCQQNTSPNIQIFLGNGLGGFTPQTAFANGGSGALDIIAADFDGDGKLDIATANSASNNVYVGKGVGNGTFTTVNNYAVGGGPAGIAYADFNGDGIIDIGTSNANTNNLGTNVSILLGTGVGAAFGTLTNYNAGSGPYSFTAGDFNGDGKPDIVAANYSSNNATVYLNATTLATANATTPACSGGTTSNTIGLTGPAGLSAYSWTGPNSYTNSTQSPTITNPATADAGVYTLKVTDSHGCTASASTVSVVVNNSPVTTQTISQCSSFVVGSTRHNTSGTYIDKLAAIDGCDSTVTTHLTINAKTTSQTFNKCIGQTVTVGSHTYNESGVYTDHFTAHNGCDSAVTTTLNVFFGATAAPATVSNTTTLTVGTGPQYGATADFDGDGNIDYAVANSITGTVSIFLGNGSGGFHQAANSPFLVGGSSGSGPVTVISGDFNKDGIIDLATNNSGTDNATVLMGNGSGGVWNGTFTLFTLNLSGSSQQTIASGDFNGDGYTDLAIPCNTSNSMKIFLNTAAGAAPTINPFPTNANSSIGLSTAVTGPANSPRAVAVADYNNDGNLDLAVSFQSTGINVQVLLGNGIGGFTTLAAFASGGVGDIDLTSGDFNHDGNVDLAVANANSGTVSVMFGNGSGGFALNSSPTVGSSPTGITYVDFNGDGINDLLVANSGTAGAGSISVLLGNSTGGFTATTALNGGNYPYVPTIGDFNGDGKPDIAAANFGTGSGNGTTATILINTTSLTSGASANTPVCAGNPLNLIGERSGLASYSWSGPNSFSSAAQSPTIASPTTAASGVYTLKVVDSHGCSTSASTTAVVVNAVSSTSQTINACGQYAVGSIIHTTNGTYTDVLLSSKGCDSTVTTHLTVTPSATSAQSLSICAGQSVTVGTETHTGPGNYTDRIGGGAHSACDSVVATNLKVLFGSGAASFASAGSPLTSGTGPLLGTTGDFNGDSKMDYASANYTSNTVSVYIGNGNGTFQAKVDYPVGVNPVGVITGDFNNDGKTDLATNNAGSNDETVLLGNGDGTFRVVGMSASGANPQYGAIGDFNHDGKLDYAVANNGGNSVSIFINNGDGTFKSHVDKTVGAGPVMVISGDFNGDGILDLATDNSNAAAGAGVSVLLGNGDGTFQNHVDFPITVGGTQAITSGDYNGDGKLDIAVSNYNASGGTTISILLNNAVSPALGFAGPVDYQTGSSGPRGIITADFNGDGLPDLATGNQTGGNISVLINNSASPGTFFPGVNYATSAGCLSLTSGDFNRDGIVDLAGGNENGSTVTIYLGNGDGTFTAAVPSTITVGSGTTGGLTGIACADVNGDGKPDLVTANNGQPTFSGNSVSVLLGNGSGGFATPVNYQVGVAPYGVSIGDFNGDGFPDIAGVNYNSSNVYVLPGKGDGTFITYQVGLAPQALTSADFDGDGIADLAVSNYTSSTESILLGYGNGTFKPKVDYPVGTNPRQVITGDFNEDGKVDLAIADQGASSNNVSILRGNGNGTFQTVVNFTAGGSPIGITSADFNGDGKPDLIVATQNTTVAYLQNNGTSPALSFSAATTLAAGSNTTGIGTSDYNGDGNADIAVANFGANNVSILLGNGSGGFQSHVDFPAGTGPYSITNADFNGDGKPDIAVNNYTGSNVSILLNTTATVPAPATAGSTSPVCPNGTLNLTGGANGLVNYVWTGPNNFVDSTQSPILVSPTTAGGGTYTIVVTDSRGCSGTANTVVVLKTLPLVTVNPASAVCTGLTVQSLTASGASTYVWAPIANLTPSAGTSATETAQISQLTFYTVTGTAADGCTNTTVVPVATVATGGLISPAFSIICSGGTQTLTVTGAAGHDYQWQISTDNANWSNITGATNTTYTTASGDGSTNKFYRLMAQSNSCWNVASTTGEVDVSVSNITVSVTNITDNSLTLNWSPTGTGNYSISYSGPSSATSTSVTPAKTITGLTANGTYSITVTQTGVSGCPASGTVTGITTLCAMPTGVTLSSPAPAQIQVSWTGVVGADYRVYYRPLFSYNTYFTRDVSNASSVLLTKQGANNLYASTTYEVYVSRLDCPTTGVVGQGTNPTNVTTLPTVTCATPVIDSVRSLCPVQIEVFIHDNGVNQYNVFLQRITPSILAVNSYGISGTYFTINTPYSGDQYLIAVEAKCGSALSTLYIYPGNVTVKPLCNAPTNLVLSNPTCHGFTASWNSDQCLSNSASAYDFYLRVAGTINYNSYGVPLPGSGIGPHELLNFLTSDRTYQVFVRSVYNCNGFVTYGPTSDVETITTLSSGCRDEDATQPQENKPAVQQYSQDNSEVFSLYPNPNIGKFVVDLSRLNMEEDAVRIEVFNMLGQTVITQLTTISGGHMSEYINLPGGTAAGTYIVRLTAGKNVYTAKINVSK